MIQRLVIIGLFAFCAAYTFGATRLSFGALSTPQSGFVPLIVGICGMVLSGATALEVFRTVGAPVDSSMDWRRAVLFTVGLGGYAALLPIIGFLISTFAATFFLLKVSQTSGWWRPLLIAGLTAVFLDVLFEHVLEISMP